MTCSRSGRRRPPGPVLARDRRKAAPTTDTRRNTAERRRHSRRQPPLPVIRIRIRHSFEDTQHQSGGEPNTDGSKHCSPPCRALDTTQTYLDTIGNNIANVNTDGYKQQDVDFVDLLSEQISGATAPPSPSGSGAGINPLAVGSGVRVGAISSDLSDGSLQQDRPAQRDVAISGSGFLVAEQGGQQVFT